MVLILTARSGPAGQQKSVVAESNPPVGVEVSDLDSSLTLGRYLQHQDDGATGLFWDRRFQDLRECFIGGGLASGTIGELGWSFTATGAAALSRLAAVSKHPGIVRSTVGGAATGRLSMHFADGVFLNALDYVDFLLRSSPLVPDAVNARSIAIGCGDTIDAAFLGTHSVGFLTFPGQDQGLGFPTNNWMAYTRSGGGGAQQTTMDTGVLATGTTDWRLFRIQRVLTGIPRYLFFIDDLSAPVATITTNFPAQPQNIGYRSAVGDLNVGNQTVDFDEMYFRSDDQGSRIGP